MDPCSRREAGSHKLSWVLPRHTRRGHSDFRLRPTSRDRIRWVQRPVECLRSARRGSAPVRKSVGNAVFGIHRRPSGWRRRPVSVETLCHTCLSHVWYSGWKGELILILPCTKYFGHRRMGSTELGPPFAILQLRGLCWIPSWTFVNDTVYNSGIFCSPFFFCYCMSFKNSYSNKTQLCFSNFVSSAISSWRLRLLRTAVLRASSSAERCLRSSFHAKRCSSNWASYASRWACSAVMCGSLLWIIVPNLANQLFMSEVR